MFLLHLMYCYPLNTTVMKQVSKLVCNKSRLFIYQNLFFIYPIFLLLMVSCGDDDIGPPVTPPPTTTTVSKKFKSDREREIYRGYLNGAVKTSGSTTNAQTTAELKVTEKASKLSNDKTVNKAAVITLDSVVGTFNNTIIYTTKNVTLSATPTTTDVSNSKITYSHLFVWDGNSNSASWKIYDNGEVLATQTSQTGIEGRVMLDFFDDENTTSVDSIKGIKTGYLDIVIKNIEIQGELEYTGGPGPSGGYLFVEDDGNNNTAATGDVAINPFLNDSPKPQTTITMKNVQIPDSTYTQNTVDEDRAVFRDIFVQNSGPVQYEVTITSNLEDFITTTTVVDIYPDEEGEQNGVKRVDLTDVKDSQNITTFVYNLNNPSQTVSGAIINMIDADTQEVMYTLTTDSEGKVLFNNVPEKRNIRLKLCKSGYYTKTNETYSVPDIEYTYQMGKPLNMVGVEKITLPDNSQLSAADIMTELTTVFDISFILGNKPIYLPPANQREAVKEHFNEFAELLGMPGAFTFVNSAGPSTYDASYYANPYPQNRDFTPMTSNVDNYAGGNGNTNVRDLFNGNQIITNMQLWNLGGIGDWSSTDHEIFRALNKSNSHSQWPTPLDSNAGTSIPLKDSPKTLAIQKLQTRTAVMHYNTLDNNWEIVEYALPVKYE